MKKGLFFVAHGRNGDGSVLTGVAHSTRVHRNTPPAVAAFFSVEGDDDEEVVIVKNPPQCRRLQVVSDLNPGVIRRFRNI